jgi:hypothetical protein
MSLKEYERKRSFGKTVGANFQMARHPTPNPQKELRLSDSCHLTIARLHGTFRLGR